MAITEVFLPLFLKFVALGIFFLRGFTLSSYQRPLYWKGRKEN